MDISLDEFRCALSCVALQLVILRIIKLFVVIQSSAGLYLLIDVDAYNCSKFRYIISIQYTVLRCVMIQLNVVRHAYQNIVDCSKFRYNISIHIQYSIYSIASAALASNDPTMHLSAFDLSFDLKLSKIVRKHCMYGSPHHSNRSQFANLSNDRFV